MFNFFKKFVSCGSCGTNEPRGGSQEKKCMACDCPCDEHKEHSHDCHSCGHAHGDDGKCHCGCE